MVKNKKKKIYVGLGMSLENSFFFSTKEGCGHCRIDVGIEGGLVYYR